MAKEQALLVNGEIAHGVSFERHELVDRTDFLVSTVHIWVWRKSSTGAEVLIQKRSPSKAVKPGMFDISAAGHVDEGETSIAAAIRETQEEIGLVAELDKIEFAFRLRKTNVANCIATVYLCQVDSSFIPKFDDGEVESTKWFSMSDFRKVIENPEIYDFSNHGEGYFTLLLERLEIAAG